MEKKDYTLKEIIFGLRNEYLENEKKLEALKKYIDITTDKKIQEFEFYIKKSKKDNATTLKCELEIKKNLINYLVDKYMIAVDDYKELIQLAHDYNGEKRYVEISDIRNGDINARKENEFYYKADKVLTSEFVTNVPNICEITTHKDEFYLTPNYISLFTHDNPILPLSHISYRPKTDELTIMGYYDRVTLSQFKEILDERIPNDQFTDYMKDKIESNYQDKNIHINGVSYTKNTQYFKINEDEKKLVLSRNLKK